MNPRRAYGTALALLALGGLGLVVAYGMGWGIVQVPVIAGAEGAVREHELTGRDLLPAAAMAGWVALAGLAGIVATRSWGRQLVAAIILLAGLLGAIAAVSYALSPQGYAQSAVALLGVGTSTATVTVGPAWVIAAGSGLVVVVAAVWALVRGRTWPSLGGRYERRPRAGRQLSAWEAQDMGQDPTDDLVE